MTRTWDVNTHRHVDLPGSEQGVAIIPRTTPAVPADDGQGIWWNLEQTGARWNPEQLLEVLTFSGVRSFRFAHEIAIPTVREQIAYTRPVAPPHPGEPEPNRYPWLAPETFGRLVGDVMMDLIYHDGTTATMSATRAREFGHHKTITWMRYAHSVHTVEAAAEIRGALSDALSSDDRERIQADLDDEHSVEFTGGSVSYYRVRVKCPTTAGVEPYTAECNDIIEALGLDYAEGNVLKAVWRIAAARNGLRKKGHDDNVYDSEKIVFFGERMLVAAREQS